MAWTQISPTTTSNWQDADTRVGDIVFDADIAFDAEVAFDGGANPDLVWQQVNSTTTSQWTAAH